jgi:asparagine synthase (glutamine-hydrolysing)
MSGIAGAIWAASRPPVTLDDLRRMLAAVGDATTGSRSTHWAAPTTGQGHFPTPGAALGQATPRDAGPESSHGGLASNESGTCWALLDGRIDNRAALRQRLEGAGHVLLQSLQGRLNAVDAELLVHLYEDEGGECFTHLDGPYAAAIWDAAQRTLLLARDPLGQRPLVLRNESGRLFFASQARAVLAGSATTAEITPAAIDEFLTYGYVPHPHSVFAGLQKLPPGYVAALHDGQLSFSRHWDADFSSEDSSRNPHDWERDIREGLRRGVRHLAESEQPLAVWLSGGADGAIVAAEAKAQGVRPVAAITLGGDPQPADDVRRAARLAETLGARHLAVALPQGNELARELHLLVAALDEPLATPALIAWRRLAQATSNEAPLALTGLGADELFAGLPRHAAALTTVDRLPAWVRLALAGPARGNNDNGGRGRPVPTSKARQQAHLNRVAVFDELARAQLYQDDFLTRLPAADPFDFLRAAFGHLPGRDPLTSVSLADLVTSLPGADLASCHAATAGIGLDLAHPFLRAPLVELAARIPRRWKLRWGQGKWILRRAYRGLLPPETLNQRHRPLHVPAADWLRGPLLDLARDVLLGSTALSRGYFRAEVIKGLLDAHESGTADHSQKVWALLVLELWQQRPAAAGQAAH